MKVQNMTRIRSESQTETNLGAAFVKLNPNSKVQYYSIGQRIHHRIFESGRAYSSTWPKNSKSFIPTDLSSRAECLSWLM